MSDIHEVDDELDFESSPPVKVAAPQCPCCRETGTRKCTICKSVSYCSTLCQEAEWPAHKQLCKKFATQSIRPNKDARRAIIFPHNSEKPQLLWLNKSPLVEIRTLMPGSVPQPRAINYNPITRVHTGRTIHIFHANDHLLRYPDLNASIFSVTLGRQWSTFHGPVVAVAGCEAGEKELREASDMDLTLYAHTVWWLLNHHNKQPIHEFRVGRKVTAVKVNCVGEREVYGASHMEVVQVPRTHPLFEGKIVSDIAYSHISKLIGLPLLMYRLPVRKTFLNGARYSHENFEATYLQRQFKGEHSAFGFATKHYYGGNYQNALVARADGEPLSIEIVQALSDFSRWHMGQFFQVVNERHPDAGCCSEARWKELKALAVAEMTPENWETYLSDWRKVKAGVIDDPEVNGRVDGVVRMGLDEKDARKLCDYLMKCPKMWPDLASDDD